jgi:hypothetical protein
MLMLSTEILPDPNNTVWDSAGNLRDLRSFSKKAPRAKVAAIVVNRNQPHLTDRIVASLAAMPGHAGMDIYVIEMGSNLKQLSKYCSFHYPDSNYRGKCYGHNVGLRIAKSQGDYQYYWVMMNDLIYTRQDHLCTLFDIMEQNPRLGILSPTEPEAGYVNCKPKPRGDYHLVSTCDYLSLFIRSTAIDHAGFLNPEFKYCWGAIHELSYHMYNNRFHIAYCDRATMKHLGSTTYGKQKDLISRDEYKKQASRFAAFYFVKKYGKNWDQTFSAVLPKTVEVNAFPPHREIWERYLSPEEKQQCR